VTESSKEAILAKQIGDLQAVLAVTRELGATSDLDELLRCVEKAAIEVLDCETANIVLYDHETDRLLSPAAALVSAAAPIHDEIALEVVRSAQPVHVADANSDPRFNSGSSGKDNASTINLSAFPLLGREGEIVGVLEARNLDPLDPWDLELVTVFDAQVGVALQRQLLLDQFAEKQRIERDLKIARSIQQGLLPDMNPEATGFDIAGWNRPADDTGGDFWDFLRVSESTLAMAIADATGHGIGPALVMASCRALFRATSSLSNDLVEIVDRVNHRLCEDLADNRSVTAFVARLDLQENVLQYLSAGQGPLLWYSSENKEVVQLDANTVPLGFFDEVAWPQPILQPMTPGDTMLIVTDGFFEWENEDGEQYGINRLKEELQRCREKPATELIEQLYLSVLRFVGNAPQSDDLTALVIKKT
jgi:phosphoserine phosphatase